MSLAWLSLHGRQLDERRMVIVISVISALQKVDGSKSFEIALLLRRQKRDRSSVRGKKWLGSADN